MGRIHRFTTQDAERSINLDFVSHVVRESDRLIHIHIAIPCDRTIFVLDGEDAVQFWAMWSATAYRAYSMNDF